MNRCPRQDLDARNPIVLGYGYLHFIGSRHDLVSVAGSDCRCFARQSHIDETGFEDMSSSVLVVGPAGLALVKTVV